MAIESGEQPAPLFALPLYPQQGLAKCRPIRHVVWIEAARAGPAQPRDSFQRDTGKVDEGACVVMGGLGQLTASALLAYGHPIMS
jgi:hypothetical protein